MPFILFLGSLLTAAVAAFTSITRFIVELIPVVVKYSVEAAKFVWGVSFWVFVVFVAGVPLTFALYHLNMLFVFGLSWFVTSATILMIKGMLFAVLALWLRSVIRS